MCAFKILLLYFFKLSIVNLLYNCFVHGACGLRIPDITFLLNIWSLIGQAGELTRLRAASLYHILVWPSPLVPQRCLRGTNPAVVVLLFLARRASIVAQCRGAGVIIGRFFPPVTGSRLAGRRPSASDQTPDEVYSWVV